MAQKPGGGLGMTAVMQSPVDYSSYYLKAKAERDRAQAKKKREDAEYWAKLRVQRAREDAEYAPKAAKVWDALSSKFPERRELSSAEWAEIKHRANEVSMGPEAMHSEPPAETQGVFGLGLLGLGRKILFG